MVMMPWSVWPVSRQQTAIVTMLLRRWQYWPLAWGMTAWPVWQD
jgi:hypothetical protein